MRNMDNVERCRKESCMNIEKAKKIIYDNCYGVEGSFTDSLYNENMFSEEKFWNYHDSIVVLAGLKKEEKDLELSMTLSRSYQRILKEFMCHFAPSDIADFDCFPENYDEYIERLDFAILAYAEGDLSLVRDDRFDLKRNK